MSLTVEEKKTVERLENVLTNPPVLALPWATGRYPVDTDVCNEQNSCNLLKEEPNGPEKSIGHWSGTLNYKARELITTHHECLAVVSAVPLLRFYRKGNQFIVRTDNEV